MGGRPRHSCLQVSRSLWLVQPAFVVRDDRGRAHDPDTGFALFHQHLTACELFAQRYLAVGTDDLERRWMNSSNYGGTLLLVRHQIMNAVYLEVKIVKMRGSDST